jgi:hypothetical protein
LFPVLSRRGGVWLVNRVAIKEILFVSAICWRKLNLVVDQ